MGGENWRMRGNYWRMSEENWRMRGNYWRKLKLLANKTN
jgi:hypothetical protein